MPFHLTLTFPDDWEPVLKQAQVETTMTGKHAVIYEIIKKSPIVYVAWDHLGKPPLTELAKTWGWHGKRRDAHKQP